MKSSEIDIYDKTEFGTLIKNIKVTLADKNYCNVIEAHNNEMDNRKNINKNKCLEGLPFGVRLKMKGKIYPHLNGRITVVLSINTSEKTRGKAYKFINSFISCIVKIGGRVYVDKMEKNDNTMFTLLESRYRCNLYEKKVKLRERIKIENREMSPLYESEYNGELCFEVFAENIDKNTKNNWQLLHSIKIYNLGSIESEILDLFWKLRDDAISKKIIIDQEMAKHQEERAKQVKQWEEHNIREERIRMEKEELIKKQKSQEKIQNHMDKWECISKVLMYINELRSISSVSDNERNLILNYCNYVDKIYTPLYTVTKTSGIRNVITNIFLNIFQCYVILVQ